LVEAGATVGTVAEAEERGWVVERVEDEGGST
jgi:hypothetical protein